MDQAKQKTDWASAFQSISEGKKAAPTAGFGGHQPILEGRDYHRGEFSDQFPRGASRRPDYDDFGAVGKVRTAHTRGALRARSAHHGEDGRNSEFGGFLDGLANSIRKVIGGFSVGPSHGAPISREAQLRAARLAQARLTGRPAAPPRRAVAAHHGEVGERPDLDAALRSAATLGAEGVGQSTDFYSNPDVALEEFAGDVQVDKGLPTWLLALIGMVGIYATSEYLAHKGRQFANRPHRLNP
jgi:hypothetical protein